MREKRDNSADDQLEEIIRGGVASINKRAAFVKLNPPQAPPAKANPSIRKKIRAAVSRV